MRDSDKLEELVVPAVGALKKIFTQASDNLTDGEVVAGRLAATLLSTWSRLKQSERAQEATYFNMARELAKDPSQLEAYVKASMPDVPLVKVLQARQLLEGKKK